MNHTTKTSQTDSAHHDIADVSLEQTHGIIHSLKVHLLFRRQYLVNANRQIRSALLVTFVVAVPLIILNVSLHLGRVLEREAIFSNAGPELTQHIAAFDRTEFILVLVASIVFAVGVFVMTILETHQTSGAAVGIARHLGLVRDGHYGSQLKLRDSDNLQELVIPFNDMSAALAERASQTAIALQGLAEEAEHLSDGLDIAGQLRELAAYQSSLAGV